MLPHGPAPTEIQGGPSLNSSPSATGPAPNDTKQGSPAPVDVKPAPANGPAPTDPAHVAAPPAGQPSSSLPPVAPAPSNGPAAPAPTNAPVVPAPNYSAGPAIASVAPKVQQDNNTPHKSPAGPVVKGSGVPQEEVRTLQCL